MKTDISMPVSPSHVWFFFAVLGLELRAYTLSHSTSPFLCYIFSRWGLMRYLPGWLRTLILLMSVCWVARIIDVSHRYLASHVFFISFYFQPFFYLYGLTAFLTNMYLAFVFLSPFWPALTFTVLLAFLRTWLRSFSYSLSFSLTWRIYILFVFFESFTLDITHV
jgi:hypothetical protein